MPAVETADMVSREDLSDAYLNMDVRKTPLQSRMKRGKSLMNVLYSWTIEQYDGRQVTGIPENKDADSFETDKQFRVWNRTQKFWRTPHVTVEANQVNQAPADFGKMKGQIVKKTREQQRDVETKILGDSDARDDDGTIGREFMALGRVINDGVSVGSFGSALTWGDAQTTIPTNFRTPTAQIYTSYLTSISSSDNSVSAIFNEDSLITMLANRFNNLGQTTELACFCDSVLKIHFSRFFGKYKPNVRGYTAVSRTEQEAIESKNFALYGVDLLETDFGPIDINLVNWMPTRSDGTIAGRGYFIDMEHVALRPSGLWMTYQPQEDKGAGPRGLIQSILGWEFGDPRGHCKVDPATLQQTVS